MKEDSISELLRISDEKWGEYFFFQYHQNLKLDAGERNDLIHKAIACGEEKAKEVLQIGGKGGVIPILEQHHVEFHLDTSFEASASLCFASFTSPNAITVYNYYLQPAQKITEKIGEVIPEFSGVNAREILLAHELYHFFEEIEPAIFSASYRYVLKHFLFHTHHRLKAIEEIAANSFSKILNQLKFNPFVMDYILLDGVNGEYAARFYQSVIKYLS